MKTMQKGAALAVSLILVVVASMLGISAMNSSQLGERVAGNERQVSEAFMAAETGVARVTRWLDQNASSTSFWQGLSTQSIEDEQSLARNVRGADVQWDIAEFQSPANGDPDSAWIVVRGEVTATGTERLIRILYEREKPPKGLGALNIIGGLDEFNAANSNQFEIIGQLITGSDQGAAIATSALADNAQYEVINGECVAKELPENAKSNKEKIEEAIAEVNREANYQGGVREVEFPAPFNDPKDMLDFIEAIKDQYAAMADTDPKKGTAPDKMCTKSGNRCAAGGEKITVWQGDTLELKGNEAGAGVLLVLGNLKFSGTVRFDGLVIVTGNAFQISGGGNDGIFGSLIVATPVKIDNPGGDDCYQFGEAFFELDVDVDGGGNASIEYDQAKLDAAAALLQSIQIDSWQAESWQDGRPRSMGDWGACAGKDAAACVPGGGGNEEVAPE